MRDQRLRIKLAAGVWLASVQYFAVQLLVASHWKSGFSLRTNTISDLGNTVCGNYGDRLVCSPLHGLMNGSFILQGIIMAGGALLLVRQKRQGMAWRFGLAGLVIAGSGSLVIGLFPENTSSSLHIAGATLVLLIGNGGLIVLSQTPQLAGWLKRYSLLSGIVGLAGLALFMTHHTGSLGSGGAERLAAYPQTIWLIVAGSYFYRRASQQRHVGSVD